MQLMKKFNHLGEVVDSITEDVETSLAEFPKSDKLNKVKKGWDQLIVVFRRYGSKATKKPTNPQAPPHSQAKADTNQQAKKGDKPKGDDVPVQDPQNEVEDAGGNGFEAHKVDVPVQDPLPDNTICLRPGEPVPLKVIMPCIVGGKRTKEGGDRYVPTKDVPTSVDDQNVPTEDVPIYEAVPNEDVPRHRDANQGVSKDADDVDVTTPGQDEPLGAARETPYAPKKIRGRKLRDLTGQVTQLNPLTDVEKQMASFIFSPDYDTQ